MLERSEAKLWQMAKIVKIFADLVSKRLEQGRIFSFLGGEAEIFFLILHSSQQRLGPDRVTGQ
jgi:hypothetical protein